MMNNLITEPFIKKVRKAMEHLYVWPEIEELQKKEHLLTISYLQDKLNKKQFEKLLHKIQSEKPSLIISSIPELALVMDIIKLDNEIKQKELAYFTLVYEKTVAQGHECRYSIWFYETARKATAMYCATQINLP